MLKYTRGPLRLMIASVSRIWNKLRMYFKHKFFVANKNYEKWQYGE